MSDAEKIVQEITGEVPMERGQKVAQIQQTVTKPVHEALELSKHYLIRPRAIGPMDIRYAGSVGVGIIAANTKYGHKIGVEVEFPWAEADSVLYGGEQFYMVRMNRILLIRSTPVDATTATGYIEAS
jgi:hypothetical protein